MYRSMIELNPDEREVAAITEVAFMSSQPYCELKFLSFRLNVLANIADN